MYVHRLAPFHELVLKEVVPLLTRNFQLAVRKKLFDQLYLSYGAKRMYSSLVFE